MAGLPPSRNLGAGDAWGRWVEEHIQGQTSQIRRATQTATRAATAVPSVASVISEAQEELAQGFADVDSARASAETAMEEARSKTAVEIAVAIEELTDGPGGWSAGEGQDLIWFEEENDGDENIFTPVPDESDEPMPDNPPEEGGEGDDLDPAEGEEEPGEEKSDEAGDDESLDNDEDLELGEENEGNELDG